MNSVNSCLCGKPLYNPVFCKSCRDNIAIKFSKLCETLSKQHRGAGGAAICICGAGCGGTAECVALSWLKTAITTEDEVLRYYIAEAVGWNDSMELPKEL